MTSAKNCLTSHSFTCLVSCPVSHVCPSTSDECLIFFAFQPMGQLLLSSVSGQEVHLQRHWFQAVENHGNSVPSVCVNTAAKELVLSRKFQIQNSYSDRKDPISNQTLKDILGLSQHLLGTRALVGRDQKEVQKGYEKSVWMEEKTWLWLKEGGKLDITVFIKQNEICMVTGQ